MIYYSHTTRFENLICTIKKDHNEIKRQLWVLRMLDLRRDWQDYETARNRAEELEALIKRHIHEEESKLPLTFTEVSEGERLPDEIMAAVFQQHKLILAAFEDFEKSTHSMQESRWSSIEELDRIIAAHIKDEDDRVFPLLISKIRRLDSSS